MRLHYVAYYQIRFWLLLVLLCMSVSTKAGQLLTVSSQSGAFPLFVQGQAATISVSANEPLVVKKAASLLADDVERVTNSRPQLSNRFGRHDIIVATIGHNPNVDRLIQKHHIDISSIRDQWECFLLKVVDHHLLILGSDAHISFDIANYENLYPLLNETEFPDELVINYSSERFLTYLGIGAPVQG